MTENLSINLIDEGRWRQTYAEARRCELILSHPIAAARPRRAWACLPMHWSPVETIEFLREAPVETEADAEQLAAMHLRFVSDRAAALSNLHDEFVRQLGHEFHNAADPGFAQPILN